MNNDYLQFEGIEVYCACLSCEYRECGGRCLYTERTGKYPQVSCKNFYLYADEIPESEVDNG